MKIKNGLKNARGITLIALVITIIVLLILAGISISMLTGQNGILNRAQEAKEKTEVAGEEELRKLTQMQAAMNLENTTYTDNSTGVEKTVKIPAQCAVSQVDGENSLKDGLVIIDVNGNEWVWIEVPKTAEIYKTAGLNVTTFTDNEYTKIYEDLANYTEKFRDEENKGIQTGTDEWYDGCGLKESEYDNLKKKMLQSVYENAGFYIGRYEVGIGEDNTVRNYGEDYYIEHPISETPVIQANKVVYNWVRTSQAQELSERLAIGRNTSSLMFGIQWDLVLKYIESKRVYTKDGTNTLIDQTLIKSDSTKCGNYSNAIFNITNTNAKYSEDHGKTYNQVESQGYLKPISTRLLTTSAMERNSVAGIYDLAGNVWERTLEKTTITDSPCSIRGGSYDHNGVDYPVSNRSNTITSNSHYNCGFRPALY